jgi:replicative DNA helicase
MAHSDKTLRVPPHSIEAERAVLGSLLIDKDAIIKIADLINVDDFYHDVHGIIYQAIKDLYERRVPIDLLTTRSSLEDKKQLELIGGVSYLSQLVTEVHTSTHIYNYALIVKQKSTLRRLIKSGDLITGLGYNEEDPLEVLLEDAERSLFAVSQTSIREKFVHIKDVLNATYDKITELHDPATRDKYKGVVCGFNDLDNILTGFQPCDLVILAARPAMGKTALALNFAQNIAKGGKTVGLISLEMSKEQLVERMFSSLLEVDSWKLKTGKLSEEDFMRIGGVMDELYKMKIYIDDSVGNSISELRSKARRLQMEHGLDFLIVDYLQLMTVSGTSSSQNRVNEISEISRSLKNLARELRIPILALSQLSRAVELRPSKIPQLSDLRESGAIEQDADVVLMMYREDYYEEDTERAGMTDVFVRKHRSGPVGRVELAFKKERMKFYSVEKSRSYDGPPIG